MLKVFILTNFSLSRIVYCMFAIVESGDNKQKIDLSIFISFCTQRNRLSAMIVTEKETYRSLFHANGLNFFLGCRCFS